MLLENCLKVKSNSMNFIGLFSFKLHSTILESYPPDNIEVVAGLRNKNKKENRKGKFLRWQLMAKDLKGQDN